MHVPLAARFESKRQPSVSGLGFNAAIKGSRPSSAPRDSPVKATYTFPDENVGLGYSGVVERADSVCDFPDMRDLRKGGSPNKKQLTPTIMEIPIKAPQISEQQCRGVKQQGSGGVHETMQQIMQRRTQIAKGLLIPEEGGLSIKAQAASLQARPSGSGPAVSGGPFGPPGGPTQGREWGPSQVRPASASPASPSATSPARAHAHERVSNSLQIVGGSAVAANSLQDVLRSKVSELDYLNSLLIRQAEEKRNIEQQRYQLAAENHNLKVQVQEMRTRQRPWSASSAGSRPQWHDQREQQQQGTSIHMHTIQEQRQPQLVGAQRPPSSHIRPASASQHNNRVLVRKHPVFGTDSLMHRSVYTPTQGLENADGEAMASPPKDEVFLRPEAHRTLGFGPQEPDNSRGITAMRLRPQSANAAVRQISVRPVSGVRPGSARPHSSYAERLLHADADNFARFHVPLPSEDVTQRVIKALSVMRNAAGKRFVRVVDFMAPFDKLKRGHLSCTEFRRSLESCACFGDISEEEYNLVFSFFLHESTAVADVLSPTSRISYAAFCEVLQPVGDKRVKLNVDQEVLKNIGQQKQKASHSPLASNELSKEGESKLLTLIRCIIDAIRKNRISVRDFLEHLDPRSASGHGNSKSLPTSPNVNHTTGCMSRSQYLRGIRNCNIGMTFSDDELALLFCKYDRCGEFNYYRFCRDLEEASGHAS